MTTHLLRRGAAPRRTWRAVVLAASVAVAGLTTMPSGVQAADPAPEPLITTTDTTWRYVQDDTFPSAGQADSLSWTKSGFDDSSWLSGKGAFGGKIASGVQSPDYDGSRRATTQLEMNAPGQNVRVRTYFFRTDIEVKAEQLAALAKVQGRIHYDDGAIVYVNGTEVARGDVPVGSEGLNYATGGTTGLDTTDFTFDASVLVPGKNTVAVEVHNDRSSSSDIWFDLTQLTPLTHEQATPKPSRIILTPTEDPYSSQYVSFQGALQTDTVGRIQFRPAAGGDVRQVNAPLQPPSINNPFSHFSGVLTGLRPATEYAYRVSSNGHWSAWQTFETADPAEKEFSYLYYGDAQIGLDTTWPKVVDQALAKAPEAIGSVHAGDLIDVASNDTQWHNWFKGMEKAAATTNIFAAPGNHEYSGDKLMTAWKAHFEYPLYNPNDSTIGEMAKLAEGDTDVAKQYRAYFDHWSNFAAETVYFADYQDVRFITINATRDTTFLRPDVLPGCSGAECPSTKVAALWTEFQAQWLDHILTTSPSKWNVVTFHQPVYSTSSGRNEPILRQYWVPVFEKHNIDLVQMGHDHTYARGYKDTTKTETAGMTNGPVYIVSNSGAKHYVLENDERNVWTNNGATQVQKGQNITTYQVIDVAPDKLTYRSYIAEINGTATLWRNGQQLDAGQYKVGDLWDEFTVHKTDHGEKAVVEKGMAAPQFPDHSVAPTFTTDLPAQTGVRVGERAALKVAVDHAAATLQWQVDTGRGWTDVAGETGARLTLGRIGVADIGHRYRVVATAGTRTATSAATVLVDQEQGPVFTTDLPAVTQVASGDDVTLTVAATADSTVRYQWQRLAGQTWTDLTGRTGPALELSAVRADGTQYRVVATAASKSATSSATTLAVTRKGTTVRAAAKPRRGKPLTLTVRSSQAGKATVVVVHGKKRITRTVTVAEGLTKVKLGKLARKGTKATVKVTVTPTSVDHAPASVSRTFRVR